MQRKTNRLLIIVPAYNESKIIKQVYNDLINIELPLRKQVLIINDCSNDNTKEILDNCGIEYIDLPVNLGIGGAVQTGFLYAFRNNYDYLIQIDGDGQHPAKNILSLINAMFSSDSDIIIGSRFLSGIGYQSSFMRRIGISLFKGIIKILCGIKITDTTSGLRLYNKKAIAIAAKYYPDEYPEPESIVLFHLLKMKISETPVEMLKRSTGKSSIDSIKSIYYVAKVCLSILYTYIRLKQNYYAK